MSKWISVKDGLPEKVGRYLVYRNSNARNAEIRIQFFCAKDIYSKNKEDHRLRWMNTNYTEDKQITHWAPLQEPPK